MKIEIDVEELALILVTVVIIFIALNYFKVEDHKYEINLRQTTNQIKYERPQSN